MFAARRQIKAPQIILVVGALFLAFLLGAIAALFGGVPALILFSPILIVLMLLADFRVGVIVLMIIIAFQHTPFLPSFTGFNIVNYIVAGTLGIVVIGKLYNRHMPTPQFPAYFWWAYVLPILVAGMLGTTHLPEVPQEALERLGFAYESTKSYLSGVAIKPFFLMVLSWLIGTAILRSRNPRLFLIPFSIAIALPAIAILVYVLAYGIDLEILSSQYGREILSGLGLHANELGFLLATGFVMLLYVLPTLESGWGKVLLIGELALVSVALMLTFSRGGFLVYLLGVLAFLVSRKKTPYIFAGLAVVALVALVLPDAFWERITAGLNDAPSDLSAQGNDELTAGRVWVWVQLWPEFLRSPIWGSGLDSTAWSSAVKEGLFSYNHPHNLYLRVLLDMGLIGFALMAYWLARLFRDIRAVANDTSVLPQIRALASGLIVALGGMLVSGFSNGHFTPESELAFIWIGLGFVLPYFRMGENKGPVS